MIRKQPLVEGKVYHVMNKSIAGYKIFSGKRDCERMLKIIRFCCLKQPPCKISRFLNSGFTKKGDFEKRINELAMRDGRCIQVIAYCLMPTHFHLLVKQLDANGISTALAKALNSYVKYFNTKHKRKGPLFVGRFKAVLVDNDEQLLHLTRYIHLNPVTARLVESPEKWLYSSYREYICDDFLDHPLSVHVEFIHDNPHEYQKFVEDGKHYQRELSLIKAQILE